jgi:hypothetical protein
MEIYLIDRYTDTVEDVQALLSGDPAAQEQMGRDSVAQFLDDRFVKFYDEVPAGTKMEDDPEWQPYSRALREVFPGLIIKSGLEQMFFNFVAGFQKGMEFTEWLYTKEGVPTKE